MAAAIILEYTIAAPLATTINRPHRLAGSTLVDGVGVERRVKVCERRTGNYVISTVSNADGTFELTGLPPQNLANPYVVTCFDDSDTPGNALIYDRVYQVDDAGNPPQT